MSKNKSKNKSFVGEIWNFLKVRKAWLTTLIIIMVVLIGSLILFNQSGALSPSVYVPF
ncbi:MAG: hypothetical protein KAJ47_01730 [Candidatus Aenigmarchaeota archaeon]|nr:hypothetical protein [Candidatus Aenigmarchaeota archaeon]